MRGSNTVIVFFCRDAKLVSWVITIVIASSWNTIGGASAVVVLEVRNTTRFAIVV